MSVSKVRIFALLSLGLLALVLCDIRKVEARIGNSGVTETGASDIWCVGPDGAEICVDSSGSLVPTTNNDTTLGTSSFQFATAYIMDIIAGDDLTVTDDATVTDDLTVNGDTTLGDGSVDTLALNVGTITVSAVSGRSVKIGTSTTDGSFLMTIDGNARSIGIGETSPGARLEIAAIGTIGSALLVSSANASTPLLIVNGQGLTLFVRKTTTELDAAPMTPQGIGGMVFNTTLNLPCISTGPAIGAYARLTDASECR